MQKALTIVQSSIGRKALVAVSGAVLFGFVIAHLAGNLQIFLPLLAPLEPGQLHPLDAYGFALKGNKAVLWALRSVILLAVLVHVPLTIAHVRAANAARPKGYKVLTTNTDQGFFKRWARSTMALSGPIILLYLVYHLAQLTVGVHNAVPGYEFREWAVYANLVAGFRVWWIAALYMFANFLLCLHLIHGGGALLQTLGIRHSRYDRILQRTALAFALFVGMGNVLIPAAVLTGVVGSDDSVAASLTALDQYEAEHGMTHSSAETEQE